MYEEKSPELARGHSMLSRIQRKPSKIFSRYKQKLILQVVLILAVCVLIILERIFNEVYLL